MKKTFLQGASLLTLAATLVLPLQAQAHRAWILPAATVLSSDAAWVTVDAAISNDIFHTDYFPMDIKSMLVIGPKGEPVAIQNPHQGKHRSVFDIELNQAGTYKIVSAGTGAMALWKENGENKRWRGSLEEVEQAAPKGVTDVRLVETQRRIESFVTNGAPNTTALTPSKKGLELVTHTHPNDLFATETARFQLVLDGKPAAGVEVEIIPGATRYRDSQDEIKVTSDKEGFINVTWPQAGMYWLSASVSDDKTTIKNGTRRASYTATFEVLPF